MSSAVQNILERTIGDAARSAKFEVGLSFAGRFSEVTKDDLLALCKTASFPGKELTTMDIKFKGRSIPVRGQVKYEQTWDCTFYLTEDHRLKNSFENWIEALDEVHNYCDMSESKNVPKLKINHVKNKTYTTDIMIYQRDFIDEHNTSEYKLYNSFPIKVSPVQVDYSAKGIIQEFTVTFSYSHFTSQVLRGAEGNFIDELMGKLQSATDSLIASTLSYTADKIDEFLPDNLGASLNKLNAAAANIDTDIEFKKIIGDKDMEAAQKGASSESSQEESFFDVMRGLL